MHALRKLNAYTVLESPSSLVVQSQDKQLSNQSVPNHRRIWRYHSSYDHHPLSMGGTAGHVATRDERPGHLQRLGTPGGCQRDVKLKVEAAPEWNTQTEMKLSAGGVPNKHLDLGSESESANANLYERQR